MSELYDLTVLLRAKSEGMAAFKEAENSLGGVLQAAAAVGTLAVGAVAAFAVASVVHMEEAGKAAHEMAGKFGLVPTQASAWLAAANAVGVSADSMSTGFKFAAKNMETVNLAVSNGQKAPKQLTEAYAALGVQIFDNHGKLRNLNDVMFDAADAMAKMPAGAEKSGLAVKLFGRSGQDLIPILDEGRAGIQAYMDTARASGAVMSNEQVAAAWKLAQAHRQLDQAVSGVAIKFATQLMPAALALVNWITSTGIPGFEKLWAQAMKIVVVFQQWAKQLLEQMKPSLQDIAKHSEDFKRVGEAMGIVLLVLVVIIGGLIVWFVKLVDWILRGYDAFGLFMSRALDVTNNVLVGLVRGIQGVVGWFKELWTWANNAAGAVAGAFSSLGGNPIVHEFLHLLGVPGFQFGGTVPGPIGTPTLAIVHGGERVQTPAQQQAGSGEAVINRDQLDELIELLRTIAGNTASSVFGTTAYGRS